jgi:hypothetical protein
MLASHSERKRLRERKQRAGGAILPALDDAKTLPEQFPAKVTVSVDFFKYIHSMLLAMSEHHRKFMFSSFKN